MTALKIEKVPFGEFTREIAQPETKAEVTSRDAIIKVITENVKNIVDSLGDIVIYGLTHDETFVRGGLFSTKDIKTHDTIELKLTVKLPVQ